MFFSVGVATFVEMVEALTIILAVVASRGVRTAVAGALAALVVLTLLIGTAGSALTHFDLRPLKFVIGAFLIWFGGKWLRKAILRAAGLKKLHDEAEIFRSELESLSNKSSRNRYGVDMVGAATAFNGVLVEGIEVALIVVAVGSTPSRLHYAVYGSLASLILVIVLGVALRTPLTKIPENTLKLIVGVMLTSLGTTWIGEAAGLTWPLGDWSLAGIVLLVAAFATTAIFMLKRRSSAMSNSV